MLNIGADREITIEGLARMVWGLVRDDEPRLHKVPLATFGKYEDVQRRIPDNRGATQVLGYTPASPSRRVCPAPSRGSATSWRAPASCDPRRGAPFNEAGNMAALLASIAERLEPLAQRHRIVVVDMKLHTYGTADACSEGGVRGTARGGRAPTYRTLRSGRSLPHRLPARAPDGGSRSTSW